MGFIELWDGEARLVSSETRLELVFINKELEQGVS
jgi:hypothetical protein